MLSVVGPTAVGKTSFMLSIAPELVSNTKYEGINLISADSRQVYRGMELLTGADVPPDFTQRTDLALPHPWFQTGVIALHGVSILEPTQEWSVRHFQQLARSVISYSYSRNYLPVLIGGTGLYHQCVDKQDSQFRVGPNDEVRTQAAQMKVDELQQWAQQVHPDHYDQMNHSDRFNPRRLVRVIEIGLQRQSLPQQLGDEISATSPITPHSYLGLTTDLKHLKHKIQMRVEQRFIKGAVDEVRELLNSSFTIDSSALTTLGVREIGAFLQGELTEEECLNLWSLHEFQYAKRQITWWKKHPVQWFNLQNADWKSKAFDYILHLC